MVSVLSLLSGVLTYFAFAPVGIWWCAPVGLALLIYQLRSPVLSRRILNVLLFATAFFAPLLAWSNIYVGDAPWLILTSLQVVLTVPIAFFPMNRPRNLFLFPSLWVGVEFVRGHFPFNGFGWGRMAFSQADAPYAQVARLGGAPLLSFFVAVIALMIFMAYRRKSTVAALLLIFVVVFSSFANFSKPNLNSRTFSVVAVQGGVPTLGLDFNARARAVFENHLRATDNYLARRKSMPDVVLWPENSIDVDPFQDETVHKQLQNLADKYHVALIVGAVLHAGANFHNASILWEPKQGATSIYIKRHLTPFGEYIPLRGIAEIISPYAKNVTDFLPGEKIVIHSVGEAKFAPIICFELLDDASDRAMARRSNAFVIQTNSATFGFSPESDQQLGISRIRAIEHQRYAVSISTTGVSALIDPQGHVTHRIDAGQVGVIDTRIGLISSISLADRYGSPTEGFLVLFPGLLAAIEFGRSQRRRIKQ